MELAAQRTAPAHLWAIGTISLLWNAFGCYDYLMSHIDPAGMGLSPATLAYMQTFPAWLTAFWALGVWGSLAGSILLLMRSRHAFTAFVLSLLGLAVSQGYQMLVMHPPEAPPAALVGIIWGALIFFVIYAHRLKVDGILR